MKQLSDQMGYISEKKKKDTDPPHFASAERSDWINGWIQWCRRTTVFERLMWNSSTWVKVMSWAAAQTRSSSSNSRNTSSGSSEMETADSGQHSGLWVWKQVLVTLIQSMNPFFSEAETGIQCSWLLTSHVPVLYTVVLISLHSLPEFVKYWSFFFF